MKINHPRLVRLLQTAYSAERAAALAYVGHAHSVSDDVQKRAIHRIEADEWEHRAAVRKIMKSCGVPVSQWLEWKFYVIGRTIGAACHVIGWFMPYFFCREA